MLALRLKQYLENVPDDANILIYVAKTGETRQLRGDDLDMDHDKNVIIGAEYEVPVKFTTINLKDLPSSAQRAWRRREK